MNNSVPMLQVQIELISDSHKDKAMCVLGLNDIIYMMPEYSPKDYKKLYPRMPI